MVRDKKGGREGWGEWCMVNFFVHIKLRIIIRPTHANVWESMGKPCSCMQFIKSRIFYYKPRENPYQYYKSHENPFRYYKSCENPYQVLQVMCVTVTRCEFLSDAPFSNLVSERCALQMNCKCMSGWSCTHEPTQQSQWAKMGLSYSIRQGE